MKTNNLTSFILSAVMMLFTGCSLTAQTDKYEFKRTAPSGQSWTAPHAATVNNSVLTLDNTGAPVFAPHSNFLTVDALPNATTLAKISEADGLPLWSGSAWPGGGGGTDISPWTIGVWGTPNDAIDMFKLYNPTYGDVEISRFSGAGEGLVVKAAGFYASKEIKVGISYLNIQDGKLHTNSDFSARALHSILYDGSPTCVPNLGVINGLAPGLAATKFLGGVVKIGDGIDVDAGVISVSANSVLPKAEFINMPQTTVFSVPADAHGKTFVLSVTEASSEMRIDIGSSSAGMSGGTAFKIIFLGNQLAGYISVSAGGVNISGVISGIGTISPAPGIMLNAPNGFELNVVYVSATVGFVVTGVQY